MRPRTIWQRLNRALLLLIVLLLAGVGLSLWVAISYSNTRTRQADLSGRCDRIRFDVMVMGDTVRGLSLDPKKQSETTRLGEAEEELQKTLSSIEKDFPGLTTAVKHLSAFALGTGAGTFGEFKTNVLAIAGSDVANALTYYNATYPVVSLQRDKEFRELASQAVVVNAKESDRSFTIAV